MDRSKTKVRIFVGFLIAVFAVNPYITSKSLAATTTLTVVTTQDNVPVSTIPAVTFAGGAEATSDGTLPAITFTSGTNADLVSIPAITYIGGVDEIKASQTLTVNTLPANNETITIGNCVVTFADGAESGDNSGFVVDSDCSDGAAIINNYTKASPGLPRYATQIAISLRGLTGVSDDVHGTLTVGGSGTDAIFTTTGTETTAGDIVFADGTSEKITNVAVTSVVGVLASATITVPDGLAADATDHSITIDGVVINLGTSSLLASGVASKIACLSDDSPCSVSRDFSSGTSYAAGSPYTVTNLIGADVTLTRTSGGASDNGVSLTIEDADYTATNSNPSVARFTIADALYGGDPYDHLVTIDGIADIDLDPLATGTSKTTAQIATAIKDAIDADGTKDYTTDISGSTITLTEKSLGLVGNGVTLPVTDGHYTTTGPIAATDTITIPSGLSADAADHSVTIDGITVDLETSALDASGVASAIRAGITGSGSYAGKDYTVSGSGADIVFTKETGGTAGNGALPVQEGDDYAYGTKAQIVTITPADVTAGETATVTINSVRYSYLIQSGNSAADVVSGLKAAITSPAVATSGTDTLILTANAPGTAFTATSGLIDPPVVNTKSKSKPKPKPREVNQNSSVVTQGDLLVQRGKRFSKKSYVALYVEKAIGTYYPPIMIRTDKRGNFTVTYSVNKPAGTYKWYILDIKKDKKSKVLRYRVK